MMLGLWRMECTRHIIKILKNSCIFPCHYHRLINSQVPLFATNASCFFSTTVEEPKDVIVRERIQIQKSTVKKIKREPFVKNFFCGKIDTDLLAFPEIIDKPQVKAVEDSVQCINNWYKNHASSLQFSAEGKIPEDVLHELKEMGLFGRLVPSEYGGLDLNYSAMLRVNEALSLDWSVFTTLAAHEFLAVQMLLIAGNEQQKAKYLPLLASGKSIAAACWSEHGSGSDLNKISTTADPDADGKFFSVNGTKHWVTNGSMADIFLVFVRTPNVRDENEAIISLLLIDRNSDGITISPQCNKTGLHGTENSTVNFENVQVPCENLIGNIGDGGQILLKAFETCHLGMASFTFGALKELLDLTTEYVINTERFDVPMTSLPIIKLRLAKIATTIYAMESCSYFTAGLIDSTEDPDCAVECAILKVLNSEGTLYCLREMRKIFGSASLLKGHFLETYYQDAQALEWFEGTNDVTRLFIVLASLQYVGQKKAEHIAKYRNPFYYPYDYFKAFWRYGRIMSGNVSYSQDVAGNLHPSLVFPGNRLEEYVQKLDVQVDHVFTEHGQHVVDHQLDPVILANVAIDLYAMTAVLSRSSRSYCIGLRNSDPETRMAFAFCNDAYLRLQKHFQRLTKGVYANMNEHYLIVADQLIDWRGYYPEHPLKYNF